MPEIEDLPKQTAEFGAREKRLLIKDKSERQLREEYATHIHGVVLRIIGVVFALFPSFKQVIVSCYSQRLDKGTGHLADDYLLSVAADQDKYSELNFTSIDQIDPIKSIERFELNRNMTATHIFKVVKPIDADKE